MIRLTNTNLYKGHELLISSRSNINVPAYDRYGALIFQETTCQNGWHGPYSKGIFQPELLNNSRKVSQ